MIHACAMPATHLCGLYCLIQSDSRRKVQQRSHNYSLAANALYETAANNRKNVETCWNQSVGESVTLACKSVMSLYCNKGTNAAHWTSTSSRSIRVRPCHCPGKKATWRKGEARPKNDAVATLLDCLSSHNLCSHNFMSRYEKSQKHGTHKAKRHEPTLFTAHASKLPEWVKQKDIKSESSHWIQQILHVQKSPCKKASWVGESINNRIDTLCLTYKSTLDLKYVM